MLTDYKIKKIVDSGTGREILIDVYEGEMKDVKDADGKIALTYVRSTKLKSYTESFSLDKGIADITTKANVELAKDVTRTPIDQQKINLSDAKNF